MTSIASCRLYTFVDTAYLHHRLASEVAKQLCDGGSDIIQLRAKGHSIGEIARMADTLWPIAEQARVHFVINDHPSIARCLGRPFVHLGQEDFFDAGYQHAGELDRESGKQTANSTLGLIPSASDRRLQIGLSSHAPDQAERAIAAGADYIAIGPVFATGTKPGRPPTTLTYVRWAAANVHIPWFAIGGITLDNLDNVLEAGARRVCVVSAILNAPNVAKACQQFRERLLSAPL